MPTVEIELILCVNAGKRPAPTMCSPAAGSVWPPGIRIPTVEIALLRCQAAGSVWPPGDRMPTVEIELILCVNAGKRPAPTMCSPAAGSVWPPGIRIPTVEIALLR